MQRTVRLAGIGVVFLVLLFLLTSLWGRKDSYHDKPRSIFPAAYLEISAEAQSGKPEPVFQYSHTDRVSDLAFSPKTGLLAAGGENYIDILNTRTWILEHTIQLPARNPGDSRSYNTKALSFAPDGKRLAHLAPGGKVEIWDATSGNLQKTLPDNIGIPVDVAWSPDGQMIAAGGSDGANAGKAYVWNVNSGKLLFTLPIGRNVAFSNDGKIIGAAGEYDAALFNAKTGKRIQTIKDKSGVMGPIAFSPDGKLVATGGEDPNWDPGPLPRDETGQEYAPSEAFYSHELKVKVWDLRTGKRVRILPGHNNLGGGTTVLQFSPDSRRLFSFGDGSSTIWNVKTGKSVRNFDSTYTAAISSDFRMFANAGEELKVYSVASGEEISMVQSPPIPIRSIAFSPDGKLLASGEQWQDVTLHVWDIEHGQLLHALQGPPSDLSSIGFLPSGLMLANSLNGIWIIDSRSGKVQKKMIGPKESDEFIGPEQRWALLTPDGSRLISESGNGLHKGYVVRDAVSNKFISNIDGGMGWIADAAFSPDGRYMAVPTGHRPTRVSVFDLNTGAEESQLEGVPEGAVIMVFSPDGKTIAGSLPSPVRMPAEEVVADNKIALWDRATGKVKKEIKLERDLAHAARTLAYSSDGRVIAIGLEGEIRLFDSSSLGTVGKIKTDGLVSAVAFSPDGRRIAAGTEDGKIRLWDLEKRSLLVTLVSFPGKERSKVSQEWIAYTPDGFYDWSPSASKLVMWRLNGKLYPASAFEKEFRRKGLLSGF